MTCVERGYAFIQMNQTVGAISRVTGSPHAINGEVSKHVMFWCRLFLIGNGVALARPHIKFSFGHSFPDVNSLKASPSDRILHSPSSTPMDLALFRLSWPTFLKCR